MTSQEEKILVVVSQYENKSLTASSYLKKRIKLEFFSPYESKKEFFTDLLKVAVGPLAAFFLMLGRSFEVFHNIFRAFKHFFTGEAKKSLNDFNQAGHGFVFVIGLGIALPLIPLVNLIKVMLRTGTTLAKADFFAEELSESSPCFFKNAEGKTFLIPSFSPTFAESPALSKISLLEDNSSPEEDESLNLAFFPR